MVLFLMDLLILAGIIVFVVDILIPAFTEKEFFWFLKSVFKPKEDNKENNQNQ